MQDQWRTFGNEIFGRNQELEQACKDLAVFCRQRSPTGRKHQVLLAVRSALDMALCLKLLPEKNAGALTLRASCLLHSVLPVLPHRSLAFVSCLLVIQVIIL